jgi:hypothetical protein
MTTSSLSLLNCAVAQIKTGRHRGLPLQKMFDKSNRYKKTQGNEPVELRACPFLR